MSTWAGNLIKVARHDSGLSQRKLARRAGTSQATISAYESGSKSPTLDTLARIVRAAGQDLLIQVVPYDPHDEVIAAYETSLPDRVRRRHRDRELRDLNRVRKARGLPAVSEEEMASLSG
ncbi:MAG: helix-turn-helix transcriptional regulator [Actinomycetota bacterium]